MSFLPIFLKLEGRRCLLVGAGTVALEKIGSLLRTGAVLRVVAPEARDEVSALAREGKLEWVRKTFEPADLDGQFVAITATNVPAVNESVYRSAVERGIACNSVDDIPNCDFYFGSVVSRGDLQIAISTAGESPALAQRLRREIDAQLPSDLGPWLRSLGELRREVLETHPRGEERRLLLHELAQRQICDSSLCASRNLARRGSQAAAAGHVYLVGAGPGDPELLTVKAVRLIESAQVILHDDLVPPAILDLAPSHAVVVNVGKRCGKKSISQEEINALMVDHAHAGRSVVRLKSGDPLLFGRAAEEMAALDEAAVPCEVIPGVSAGFAAAAAVGCSLTDRNWASNVIFSTGHHAQSHNHAPLPELEDATRVVYMPGRDMTLLAAEWMASGLPADLPCAVVSHAAQPEQTVILTTLGELDAAAAEAQAPSLLIAGWAVRKASAKNAVDPDWAATRMLSYPAPIK
ncbi:MAG TPA: siroheme synthase CysG [Terracidiphilus sp.]|jgi:uroporphyrin-III C-methyltransferase/precorrin-2 dehydrogenase/sirohydrochlorin ferrochelatase|nr:siroheme synthase CysG [Terracidiphilus sp.]